jgi:hypothetical protein
MPGGVVSPDNAMDGRRPRFLPPAVLFFVACGGSPVTFENGVYHGHGISFGVGDVPSSWHRVDVDDAPLAFRDDQGSSVLVNGRCNLRSDDVPLVALTNQLIAGTTDREFLKEETIPLDKREARHTVLKAKLDGVDLVWDVYVMKKNGCVYDVVLVTPPDRFEQRSAAFDRFVMGLHTTNEGS